MRVLSLSNFFTGALLGGFIALGSGVLANRDTPSDTAIPFEDLRAFTEVFQRIKNDYVEEVDDKTLLEYAIQGMLTGLDPHSNYLNEEAYQELQIGMTGEFGGLGIEVGMDNGFVKVIAPIDDTPAQRAGIQAGDMIVRLDDQPVKGMSLGDAVKVMRGKPGTSIRLTIVRENEDKPLQITIERAIIQVRSVRSELLETGYAYVRISQFQAQTANDLSKALTTLKAENQGELKGLILDLRNNPGGVLNAAVAVSDTFLNDGLIVYTEGRVPDAYLKFKARPKDALEGAPIVVLVNAGSASASEIVAGALQDHKRAIIMGNKTFGKGSVQTIINMNNNAALKLTTARYYTPSGRSIQAEGIEPDIELRSVELKPKAQDIDLSVTEANLAGHLDGRKPSDSEKTSDSKASEESKESDDSPDSTSTDKTTETTQEKTPLLETDYAVHEALNLLKGLSIIESRRSKM
ncbi:S41 family peptidase [Thioflexithrix psekupsensis]|uniref:Peptidase S41 n=1 Tax=Thioflexithrix psekupsensis TaxID=1570016 RepID=A0A251X9U1_9GAMM|nr:S41 family peptidase [Thioflexithrix psekupsensis]OUD14282.1 peptidase S41 [Thioflexithrix psekupsensis]